MNKETFIKMFQADLVYNTVDNTLHDWERWYDGMTKNDRLWLPFKSIYVIDEGVFIDVGVGFRIILKCGTRPSMIVFDNSP